MKKDVRLMKKRGKDLTKLIHVLDMLSNGVPLSADLHDHTLSGNLHDFRECHIEPDWLLLYQIHDNELVLTATATGTHADLFRK